MIDEIRAFDPGFDIVVVDDGSTDRTAGIAADRGAHVLRLPFNLGIGGAVQTGYRFAFERGYDIAVQIDGDGQHDPAQLPRSWSRCSPGRPILRRVALRERQRLPVVRLRAGSGSGCSRGSCLRSCGRR